MSLESRVGPNLELPANLFEGNFDVNSYFRGNHLLRKSAKEFGEGVIQSYQYFGYDKEHMLQSLRDVYATFEGSAEEKTKLRRLLSSVRAKAVWHDKEYGNFITSPETDTLGEERVSKSHVVSEMFQFALRAGKGVVQNVEKDIAMLAQIPDKYRRVIPVFAALSAVVFCALLPTYVQHLNAQEEDLRKEADQLTDTNHVDTTNLIEYQSVNFDALKESALPLQGEKLSDFPKESSDRTENSIAGQKNSNLLALSSIAENQNSQVAETTEVSDVESQINYLNAQLQEFNGQMSDTIFLVLHEASVGILLEKDSQGMYRVTNQFPVGLATNHNRAYGERLTPLSIDRVDSFVEYSVPDPVFGRLVIGLDTVSGGHQAAEIHQNFPGNSENIQSINNSTGCVTVDASTSYLLQQQLKAGDFVLVVPNTNVDIRSLFDIEVSAQGEISAKKEIMSIWDYYTSPMSYSLSGK